MSHTTVIDVLVVGGGQAGLATAYLLSRAGLRCTILDASDRVGDVWRKRWNSLRLFTPGWYSGLPGLPFDTADGYPTKGEVAAYLERYASSFELEVRSRHEVTALRQPDDGVFEASCAQGSFRAANVVVATGPFQKPRVPVLSGRLDDGILQLHSASYRAPEQLPAGRILVVGAGASGTQIAEELAASRTVYLAAGGNIRRLPQRLLGKDIFWWLELLGISRITVDSALGQRLSRTEAYIGPSLQQLAKRTGIELVERAEELRGRSVLVRGGRALEIDAIVWATGFAPDYRWLDLPVLSDSGWPRHQRGVTDVAGLYFVGLPWQHTRGSGLIGGVGKDAAFIAERIATRTGVARR